MKVGNAVSRLGGALRRLGPLGFLSVLVRTTVKLGPFGVLRLGSSGKPFQAAATAPAAPRTPAWPPTLDEQGLVPAPAWDRWLKARLLGAPAEAPTAAIRLVDPADPDGLAGLAPDTLCVFLRPGDRPRPELAGALAAVIADPAVQAVSFDLWRRTEDAVQPLLLPGANPVLLRARDYLHGRVALRAALAHGAGDPRERLLRWLEGQTVEGARAGWRHLPLPLVEAAVSDAEARAPLDLAGRAGLVAEGEPVSAVICTRDKGHLTRQLVRQLLRLPPTTLAEVLIVSNNTSNPYALRTLHDLQEDSRVRVIRRDEPFNFSRLNNAAAAMTRGRGPLLFLNDDISPVSEHWLDILRARLAEPGTGAVGPLLLYPREQVQEAGMYLRRLGGAGHSLRGALLPQGDPLGLTAAEREVSALTGAALLVDRDAFWAAGGFDEDLAIALQDVDLCLKLNAAGLRNLFEPRAVLLHMESTTVGALIEAPVIAEQRWREWSRFMERWGDRIEADPFHPAGFDPDDEGLRRLARP